ncbi:putative sphingoid long-chain base transporter RSB1 [Podospora didyma]|uniref:Sphingoid long-chain base transporter RSB1 n=1 Tax=Podospora didyma TaxID=330526 RepID=A0AAE0U7W6_9PEZI|nr:putative sphingoid long-chain base transporter RSB1 [Podospora didyma]
MTDFRDLFPPPTGYPTWGKYCSENPDDPICENVGGYYEYRPSLAANSIFAALFGISFLGFAVTYAMTRRGGGFTIAFLLGTLTEVIGYVGRIMSYKNRWQDTGFMMQICCLTIAPAFLSAGIYLCLRRIVYAFGPENSRIPPLWYTRIFIPCDIISLIMQAAGGAIASIAERDQQDLLKAGNNIMLAGLAFQVFTLVIFMAACIDFGVNVLVRQRRLGADALDQSAEARELRSSWQFKAVLGALTISTITIFWRSVYRVAELSNGWDGPLMKREDLFIGFEGVMVIVACFVLNAFHPSVGMRMLMDSTFKQAMRQGHKKKNNSSDGSFGKSEQTSDADNSGYAV